MNAYYNTVLLYIVRAHPRKRKHYHRCSSSSSAPSSPSPSPSSRSRSSSSSSCSCSCKAASTAWGHFDHWQSISRHVTTVSCWFQENKFLAICWCAVFTLRINVLKQCADSRSKESEEDWIVKFQNATTLLYAGIRLIFAHPWSKDCKIQYDTPSLLLLSGWISDLSILRHIFSAFFSHTRKQRGPRVRVMMFHNVLWAYDYASNYSCKSTQGCGQCKWRDES